MGRSVRAALVAAALLGVFTPVRADEPPHPAYAPAIPGTLVQSQVVYLAGEAMHSEWRGVLSKKLVGTGHGQRFYQWYLSIYQIDGTTYHLRYQSPRDGGPFAKVAKAEGAPMWFPYQDASIAGAGELMDSGVQQLVVVSHQTGADCGSAEITVFGYDAKKNAVVPEVSLENACSLNAVLAPDRSLRISGPYYKPDAALCCPTNPQATAVLRFRGGRWTLTPSWYRVYPRAFPAS